MQEPTSNFGRCRDDMSAHLKTGICHLCLKRRSLKNSHILPSFVFRWLKKTSGTGFTRSGRLPNRRVQDGPKAKLLCGNCERRIGRGEDAFAKELFPLLTRDHPAAYAYGACLAPFAASVCWRVLVFSLAEDPVALGNLRREQASLVPKALERWRGFILGIDPTPGVHELHFIPVGLLSEARGVSAPSNLNRYLSRYVERDIVNGDDQAFVFTKIGPAIILGFIQPPKRQEWVGTRIALNGGSVGGQMSLPAQFGEYLFERAARADALQRSLSDNQRRVIAESYRRNMDRAASSGTLRAISADVEMFGMDSVFPTEREDN